MSPTMALGKHIYREVCEEKRGWNEEISPELKAKWFRWTRQLKIAEVTNDIGVQVSWNYCPSEKNLADLGSRGASIEKLYNGEWFAGPHWLEREEDWPEQPALKKTPLVSDEEKLQREVVSYAAEVERDEWDDLLVRKAILEHHSNYCLVFTVSIQQPGQLQESRQKVWSPDDR